MTWLQEDRAPIGSAQFQEIRTGNPFYQPASPTYVANSNLGMEASNTTRSSSSAARRSLFAQSQPSLRHVLDTGNSLAPLPLNLTYGRSQQELESHLNLEHARLEGTLRPTGTRLNNSPLVERSTRSRPTYSFVITGPSRRSVRTIYSRLLSNESQLFTGAILVLASRVELGTNPELIHMVKIRVRNFGAAIVVKQTLSSMNLEEQLTYPTSSDGSIVIRSLWKLKEVQDLYWPQDFGSPAISTQSDGIPISMLRR